MSEREPLSEDQQPFASADDSDSVLAVITIECILLKGSSAKGSFPITIAAVPLFPAIAILLALLSSL